MQRDVLRRRGTTEDVGEGPSSLISGSAGHGGPVALEPDVATKFREVWPEYEKMIASAERHLADGTGDHQACTRHLATTYRWLGGMALAMGQSQEASRSYFLRATANALRMMTLPGSTKGPRIVDVGLVVTPDGKAHVESHVPRP